MIAENHFVKLVELADAIEKDFEQLRKANSEIDRELNEKYHEIEIAGSFNVVQGFRHAKELQSILQKRRQIKGEVCNMHPLRSIVACVSEVEKQLVKAIEKHEACTRGEKVE